jgi:hypothetical protein
MRRPSRFPVLAATALLVGTLAGPALASADPDHDDPSGRTSAAKPDRPSRDHLVVGDNRFGTVYTHAQHGPQLGHLPQTRENVALLGRTDIRRGGEGRGADVSAFRNYAYMATRDPNGCSDAGMAVINIKNPQRPRQVGLIPATEGSFPGEGSQVVRLDTRHFTGPVLVSNNEICGEGGKGGVSLWNVKNALNPRPLTRHAGDPDAGPDFGVFNEIHSARAWQAGRRAFVVLVDNYETTDVDILNITDPRNPRFIAELDLNEFGIAQRQVLGQNSFLHDVEVKRVNGQWVMLLSYWDGGWVLLDVDDPANPRFMRDSDFPQRDPLTGRVPHEGNAHQAEFSPDNRFIVGTSEDFAPFRILVRNLADDTTVEGQQGTDSVQIQEDNPMRGRTVYVGRACPGEDPEVPPAPENATIAVVERGLCFFQDKVDAVEAAGGYTGIIIMNRTAADACKAVFAPFLESNLPVVFVGRDTGFAFFDEPYNNRQCLAGTGEEVADIAIGTVGERVAARGQFDGWGDVHLLRTRTMRQVDAYAIDEATDPRYAERFGALSVHEVAVDPDRKRLAYLSYYSGGLRVIQYGKDGIQEVGRFIARGGNNFWGVEVHRLPGGRKVVLASDIDGGLWVFRYTGP